MIKLFKRLVTKPSWKVCEYCDEKISTDPEDFGYPVHHERKCIKRIQYERQRFLSESVEERRLRVEYSAKIERFKKELLLLYHRSTSDGDKIASVLDKLMPPRSIGCYDRDGELLITWRDDLRNLLEDGDYDD